MLLTVKRVLLMLMFVFVIAFSLWLSSKLKKGPKRYVVFFVFSWSLLGLLICSTFSKGLIILPVKFLVGCFFYVWFGLRGLQWALDSFYCRKSVFVLFLINRTFSNFLDLLFDKLSWSAQDFSYNLFKEEWAPSTFLELSTLWKKGWQNYRSSSLFSLVEFVAYGMVLTFIYFNFVMEKKKPQTFTTSVLVSIIIAKYELTGVLLVSYILVLFSTALTYHVFSSLPSCIKTLELIFNAT